MDNRDRSVIEGLFQRLGEVATRTGARDAEAEAFIRQQIAAQPGAPYYMAQTIIVQEQALEAAQQRISELEQASRQPQGLFGTLFGGDQQRPSGEPRRNRGYRSVPNTAAPAGGGFLAGAAQTAVGVAGGLLLGSLITGAFAGEPAPAESDPGADADPGFDDGGSDMGGDFGGGDFGGFE